MRLISPAKERRRHMQQLREERLHGMFPFPSKEGDKLHQISDSELQHESGVVRKSPVNARVKRKQIGCNDDDEVEGNYNSCFLCFQSDGIQYTVVVKFAWPGRYVVKRYRKAEAKGRAKSEMKTTLSQRATYVFKDEGTQAEVMQAIQDALYHQRGIWKRWLWCYEILSAEEIKVSHTIVRKPVVDKRDKFHFDDVGECGRAPIRVTRLEADVIREEAQARIDNKPSSMDYEYDAACWGPPYHTDECLQGQDHGVPCLQDRLCEASNRLHGYRMQHWLKECLKNPERAETRHFLEYGLLQESFVYRREDVSISLSPGLTLPLTANQQVALPSNAEDLNRSEEMRGVYVTTGWNVRRLLLGLRAGSTHALLGVAIIWLGSVLWAGHRGDWSTALAFGQVVAASVTLVLHYT